ncbi:S53 family peptidase [Dyella flagellata]|nr:protease pro-enzyme activation domain-containing protein [Dyella flagellata]
MSLPAVTPAQQSQALLGVQTAESPRVSRTVNDADRAVLQSSHVRVLDTLAPRGAVADNTRMNHLQLVLKRSPLRQAALDTLIAEQHDPHSGKFHQWLTPQQFGEAFGVLDADIAAASAWLTSQGFTVNGVYPNKMQIDFSGTAGQIGHAFHTREKYYTVAQAGHFANETDISVPAALQDVVVGVHGLNDFRPVALHLTPRTVKFDAKTQAFHPIEAGKGATSQAINSPFTNNVRALVPYDMAKIYGVDTLHAKGITGKNVTIAVLEEASMQPSDWTSFVNLFGLRRYGGSFHQIQPQAAGFTNCSNPAVGNPAQDDGETLMDAEWATAMAPSAHVVVASCGNFDFDGLGGIVAAATNLINGTQRPDVISASYGLGEDIVDKASKSEFDLLWAQADAEGISVFVSSGDSGSSPDFNGSVIERLGVSANALATSPNDTAVGGTDIADELDHTTAKYFAARFNAQYGSALSYVPEIPWNWSCGNEVAAKSMGFSSAVAFCKQQLAEGVYPTSEAGSGGPSSVDIKPAWQRLVYHAAKDQSRDLPDVALYAGSFNNATAAIVCDAKNPCTSGFLAPVDTDGGTSLSSPLFAGIQALMDQALADKHLPKDQGNAAPTLYALAAEEYGGAAGNAPASLAACNANNGTHGTSGCAFHNITRGSNSTQCVEAAGETTPDCYFYGTMPDFITLGSNDQLQYVTVRIGLTSTSSTQYTAATQAYAARPGWSFATGLGSVNAGNLLTAWEKFVNAP